jgi:hypothetical protein
MTCRSGSTLAFFAALALLSFSGHASAADLPPVKITDANKVPACVTPGRLLAYIKNRNDKLDAKFEAMPVEYMRHGEALGLRWDYAFFQAMLETGYLKFTGDVKPDQNNFAGLGATGRGVRGESFKDVSSGSRAHLEHLLMYTGEKLANPIAQRTRNIQEWGVLTEWQKTISGPMTFAQLAKQWAPGSKGYVGDIKTLADKFFKGECNEADPRPELLAAVRGNTESVATAAKEPPNKETPKKTAKAGAPGAQAPAETAEKVGKGEALAKRAIDEAKKDGATRTGLGAGDLAAAGAASAPAETQTSAPKVTILNATPPADMAPDKAVAPDKTAPPAIETASLAGAAKSAGKEAKAEKPATASKCRVWTASYGGAKAIIIKAVADKITNYTVLDVNEGTEKRESEAYISAYAKGGEAVGEFPSQTQALDKAFELCPEG